MKYGPTESAGVRDRRVKRVSGGLGGTDEGGFDGGGYAYELFEGVAEEVGDPEVAARVDGGGVGAEEAGLWGPAGGG